MLNNSQNLIYKILKKSEKFFQTDMIYLAKNGFWLTLGQIISAISSFLLAITFANFLPKEIYGTYKYILSMIGILSIFTLSGINTSLTRSVAKGFDGSLKLALKEKIKWGSIGSLVSLGISIYYYLNGNFTLTICFIITTIFLPFMDSFNIHIAILNGKKDFKLATKYNIITQIISSVLLILTLIISKNIFLLLLIYFISYTSLRLIFLKLTIKKENLNSEIESDTISYGKHLSLMNVIVLIANQIDKIVVWQFIGSAELAIYSIAIAMPEQIKGFLGNINTLAFPKFAEKSKEEIRKNIHSKIGKLFIIVILIILIYWFLSPIIFKILFPKYLDSLFYSQLFSLGLINIPIAFIGLPILQSHGLTKELYKINILNSIIQIIFILFATYFYGLIGLIIARIITRIIVGIIYLLKLRGLKYF
ncbi:MAG TPA: oligosaccharide flippase family protein [bacterium]|nr:oligosaccharide flippase family protein [bacterium]